MRNGRRGAGGGRSWDEEEEDAANCLLPSAIHQSIKVVAVINGDGTRSASVYLSVTGEAGLLPGDLFSG